MLRPTAYCAFEVSDFAHHDYTVGSVILQDCIAHGPSDITASQAALMSTSLEFCCMR